MDIYEKALKLHEEKKGKLEIVSKVEIKDKNDLSLAYSPGVAAVSKLIANDKKSAYTHTNKGNTIAVISDGSAILGLGNLGALAAIPVMEGKCVLFKEFANVDAIPICLDTQDSEEIIKTIQNLAPNYGGINLEDISAPRCFEIEARVRESLDIPVLHDDQHGTATVVLAGLINALKIKNTSQDKVKIIINGAGAAGLAITNLLIKYGFSQIIVLDSKGAIYEGRGDLNSAKESVAKYTNKEKKAGDLADVIKDVDVFIGVSQGNILKPEMVKSMNKQAIIFALANPTPEIMPEEALTAGALLVATGRSDYPNQINNVLAFPGIFRGALDNKVKQITDKMLIKAAENLAALVADPGPYEILPNVFDKRVALVVADAIRD
ncbi:MAG: NADP-dependent malic enzyme [Patescibacteria group bacterium]|nr:NADP-dependent malic enzyme [Patescibacteria group bacterium]MDD3777920.1 NADP-dependent malic enzyme [Patescibacteria group bacterium]MDD3939513.1 NADP-dependent malic enzyme [Patescibacteria group bacterium]MDD4443738.1 NADP-dependent malic enzyme [Patescibacteria group bacterium]NCU39674.1 NADP-dependent malic enzyme [Candidatus Falkowbacteria bacterium]